MNLKEIDEALSVYIRPQTFPIAIRMCTSEAEVPERTRVPKRDLGLQVLVCQALGMARRYGWTVAVHKDDQPCPFGAIALGFIKPKPAYLDGSFSESVLPGTKESSAKTAQVMPRLEFGKYNFLLVSPLRSANFEPHLIVVYGNPAQVSRLIQGVLFARGGALTSSTLGGIACSSIIAGTIISDECQFIVCGAGDRYFALTQDDEMAFTMPISKAEITIKGVEVSHKEGRWRYPTPSFLRFQVELPPLQRHLMDLLKEVD